MIKNVNVLSNQRKTIDKITAKINSTPVSYRDFLDGIQVNWVVSGKSYMWRSNRNPDRVEVFSGNKYEMIYMYIDEM